MPQTDVIFPLYACVLHNDIRRYRIKDADIRTGIQNMKEVYKPNPKSLSSQFSDVADYNDVAHRCAYLHKYAPFHTALVVEMFSKALEAQVLKVEVANIIYSFGELQICSLGGGPGSDVLGLLTVLVSEFGYFQLSTTIIDCMVEWNATFESLIQELREGNYGVLSQLVQPQYFSWDYIGHNLLGKMSNSVNKAIQSAHIVTMVKFVSAAACKDTPEMLKKIFRSLRPGALVLYIDNAGGGFHQIIQRCAYESNLTTIFGPLKHQQYSNLEFNVKRFGYTPCLTTTVSFHVWKKSTGARNLSTENIGRRPSSQPAEIRNFNYSIVNQHKITNTNLSVTNINQIILPRNNTNANQADIGNVFHKNIPVSIKSDQRHKPEQITFPGCATGHTNKYQTVNQNNFPKSRNSMSGNSATTLSSSDYKKKTEEFKIPPSAKRQINKNPPPTLHQDTPDFRNFFSENQSTSYMSVQRQQPVTQSSSNIQTHEQSYNDHSIRETYDDKCCGCCIIL